MAYEEKWFQQERTYGNPNGLYFECSHHPNLKARIALDLLRTWVAPGAEGGEDSTGRAKARALPAGELAMKACDTAEAFFNEIERRNWMVPVVDEPLRKR